MSDFHKKIKKLLWFQVGAVLIPILIYYISYRANKLETQFYAGILAIILQLIAVLLFMRIKILGRLQDIYLNLKFSPWRLQWLVFIWVSPISITHTDLSNF